MKYGNPNILALLAAFVFTPVFSVCAAQTLEIDIDPKENVATLSENVDRPLHEAMVGIEKGSRRLSSGEMYEVNLTGEAYVSRGEGQEASVVVFHTRDSYQTGATKVMRPGETFIFKAPSRQKRVMLQAAVMDFGAVYDNHGSLTLTVTPQ